MLNLNITMTETEPLTPANLADDNNRQHRDQSLLEIQTGRSLQKVVGSIERFLLNQIDRLENALQEAQRIEEQGDVVQRLVRDLDEQREAWEQQRQRELTQLADASDKLVQGWKRLEDERRTWLTEREQPAAPSMKSAGVGDSQQTVFAHSQSENETTPTRQPQRSSQTQQSQWEQLQRDMQMHVGKSRS